MELFITRIEVEVKASQDKSRKVELENILNELDNGVLILEKLPNLV